MMKIVKSAAIIVAATAIIASGTYAWYTDSESINGVTFSADTMALKIDSDPNGNVFTPSDTFTSPYELKNLRPGDYGSQVIDIKNVGLVNALAKIKLAASGNSDLINSLNFTVSYKLENEDKSAFTQIASGPLSAWNNDMFRNMEDLPGNNVGNVKIDWNIPGSVGNEIQGRSINLNIVFGLDQKPETRDVDFSAKQQ